MAERCVVVASTISADGTKIPVGLWDGSTENKTVVWALLADLVQRGLRFEDGLLIVIVSQRWGRPQRASLWAAW